ncbi:flagellar protein FlaG [Neobacillus sp. OS1-32]|uniref:Flagellar protein FlaG n=1 Tax=Neobacillus paridis TaxID=2803862 RepID=A0ABS1TNV7_9BACI|nr:MULTISPECIES: flagellar protein FlaG [Neobacillus]MBL4952932.1 flagellar protein FlaG [Neobacillus paridis]WML31547.1 flagellar protein FlaG [Neobacillus sp. OS1-32]
MLDKISNQTPSTDLQVKQIDQVPKVKVVTAEKQEQPQQDVLTKEKTEKVIKSMNDFLKESNSHLKFQFHEKLKEYYVTIVDDETNEVIKEIPPKKMLDMYAAMTDFLGLLVDKKA